MNFFIESRLTSPPTLIRQENVLLRGCTLRNTDVVEGMIVYAGMFPTVNSVENMKQNTFLNVEIYHYFSGKESKASLNNSGRKFKRSKLERRLNKDIIWCVVILIIVCGTGAIGKTSLEIIFDVLNLQ